MQVHDEMIYLTDNGAAYCGEHLGNSARVTGFDISGQPILPITPDLAIEARDDFGYVPTCEHPKCGRRASLVFV